MSREPVSSEKAHPLQKALRQNRRSELRMGHSPFRRKRAFSFILRCGAKCWTRLIVESRSAETNETRKEGKTLRKVGMTAIFVILAAIFLPATPRAQWKTHWSYSGVDGPAHWAQLDPGYAACGGKEQSPIDIRNAVTSNLPAMKFAFKNGPLDIVNNGYTAVRVDYAPGNGNFVFVGSERYELTQFHFHHPSEERIDGKQYAMGMHFMLKSRDGRTAGIALMVNASNASRLAQPRVENVVDTLWKYMPEKAGKAHVIPAVEVNPAGLIPRDTAYYVYMGSVTAPPCTEGVKWYVLKTPVTISRAQIEAFAKLYLHDVRPVQPLNGRVVEESK